VAAKLKIELYVAEARAATDFESAIAGFVEKRAQAVAIYEDPVFTAEAKKLIAITVRHHLPTIGQVAFAEAGGLIGNGANQNDLFRRAAHFVDQILKGAKPGDLPIQQPARFELVVNTTTATALGLTLPKAFLFRADRLVE
jgi:putative ABC transport system substrate-binding protein